MENASKALIIAGAVLISILIISLGVMIYRNAADITNGNQMKEFEITAFNTKFSQYEGKKNGSQVKTLVQDCLSININEENIDRLISVGYVELADGVDASDPTKVDMTKPSGTAPGVKTWLLGSEITNNCKGSELQADATGKTTLETYSKPKTSDIKNGTTYEVSMHYSTDKSNKGLVDGILVIKRTT